MPNQDIVQYIEKHLRKGIDIELIKKRLKEAGHPISAIEEAASYVMMARSRKKISKFKIFYGLLLLLVISGFVYFIWFKATAQLEYKEAVKEIEQDKTYSQMSDVDLIKLAKDGDSKACSFIKDHNIFYACKERYWEKEDCSYEALVSEDVFQCLFRHKVGEALFEKYCVPFKDYSDCYYAIAINENNITLCYSDDDCIYNFVLAKNDSSYCNRYSDPQVCKWNFALAIKDGSICATIPDIDNECKLTFMSTDEKISFFNGFRERIRWESSESVEEFVKQMVKFYSTGMCDGLVGDFKGHPLVDVCKYYHVGSEFTLSNTSSAGFDGTQYKELCGSIGDTFIKSCCDTIISDSFIKPDCYLLR